MTRDEFRAQVEARFKEDADGGYRSEAETRLSHFSRTICAYGDFEQIMGACEALRPIARAVMEKM